MLQQGSGGSRTRRLPHIVDHLWRYVAQQLLADLLAELAAQRHGWLLRTGSARVGHHVSGD